MEPVRSFLLRWSDFRGRPRATVAATLAGPLWQRFRHPARRVSARITTWPAWVPPTRLVTSWGHLFQGRPGRHPTPPRPGRHGASGRYAVAVEACAGGRLGRAPLSASKPEDLHRHGHEDQFGDVLGGPIVLDQGQGGNCLGRPGEADGATGADHFRLT